MLGLEFKTETGLLTTAAMPDLARRCTHAQGHPTLRGRDEHGQWHTAGQSGYPSDLCRVLARGYIGAIAQRAIESGGKGGDTLAASEVAIPAQGLNGGYPERRHGRYGSTPMRRSSSPHSGRARPRKPLSRSGVSLVCVGEPTEPPSQSAPVSCACCGCSESV